MIDAQLNTHQNKARMDDGCHANHVGNVRAFAGVSTV
jgi:hypothetical protein